MQVFFFCTVLLYICIERSDRWVKSLIALYEGVLVHLPDVPVFVPGLQIGLQEVGISCHPCGNCSLNLLYLLVLL